MTKTKKIPLEFSGFRGEPDSSCLPPFVHSFRYCPPTLKQLRLFFEEVQQFDGRNCLPLIGTIGEYVPSLKELCIKIKEPGYITDEHLRAFAINLAANFKKLKQLELDFEITPHIPGSQSIYASYHPSCNSITAVGVRSIIYYINRGLQRLTHLDMRFSGYTISSGGLGWRATAGSLKKLQYLNVDFSNCPKAEDNLAKGIGLWLHNQVKNLRYLKLDFRSLYENYLLTGLNSLVSGFTVLTKLERLMLQYSIRSVSYMKIQELAPKFEQLFSRVSNIEILFVNAEIPNEDFNEAFKFAEILYADKCLKLTRKN